jgi:pimeloyl-ACP methyl ester carboxylesterase
MSNPKEPLRKGGKATLTGLSDGKIKPSYKKKRLIIVLHAWHQALERLADLQRLVQENLPDADLDIPSLPLGLFSCKNLQDLSNEIASRLDVHWRKRCEQDENGYEEIFLVGHSAGATLARTVYLCGLGTDLSADGMATGEPRPWVNRVRRIILFAAFNRGWEVSYLAQGWSAFGFALGRRIALLLNRVFGFAHIGLQLYRGSRFINEMRLRWQWFEQQRQERQQPWPLVIQLLGSRDDLIAPDDSVDIATGHNFVYLDVPFTDHYNIVNLYGPPGAEAKDAAILAKRRSVFQQAFCDDETKLHQCSELELPTKPDLSIRDVVFVIHGIRDSGYWAQHIARTVLDRAEEAGRRSEVKTLTPSYGYFGMGPFLFRQNRRVKVTWFMEHYLLARAQYPKGRISYIGHSNGTYLPASALELYPSCRFKHLGLAGSVIRSNFPWDNFLPENGSEPDEMARVERVCNFVGSDDLVVAGFPSIFEMLPFTDLGGAGHRGFQQARPGLVTNFCYASGGHSAALAEIFWDSLGDFIISGTPPEQTNQLATQRQNALARVVGSFPPLAWGLAIIVAFLLLAAFMGIGYVLGSLTPAYRAYWIGGSTVAWLWALLTMLRKI